MNLEKLDAWITVVMSAVLATVGLSYIWHAITASPHFDPVGFLFGLVFLWLAWDCSRDWQKNYSARKAEERNTNGSQ